MTKIREITAHLEEFAPLAYQESYDNAGLLTGDSDWDVKGVMICLDCTEDVLKDAIDRNCNLIVAHHPLIFGGIKRLTGANYVERTLIMAVKNDIAIYAAHTNLDNVQMGVNNQICEKLGLVNRQILSRKSGTLQKLVTFCPVSHAQVVRSAIFEAGAGHIGNYDHCSFNIEGKGTFRGGSDTNPYVGEKGSDHEEAEIRIETIFPATFQSKVIDSLLASHPYEEVAYDLYPLANTHSGIGAGMIAELVQETDEDEFLLKLKGSMNCEVVRHTKLLGKKIKKVAVCGGSGSFLLDAAIRSKADVFISGDFKYHQFFDADGKILIADIGHYESEQFTMELFSEILSEKFSNFAVHLTRILTNPINYLYGC